LLATEDVDGETVHNLLQHQPSLHSIADLSSR